MNERAEQLITDAGEKVLEYLEASGGFAVEQAPLLAQEIVTWGFWHGCLYGGIFLLVSVIPLSVGAVFVRTLLMEAKKAESVREKNDQHFGALVVGVVTLFIFGLLSSFTMEYFTIALKTHLAPRLYIIEQIGGLL